MGLDVGSGNVHEVSCPHCKRRFAAPLLAGRRSRGFKCPHCRLFVPFDRGADAPISRDPGV